MGQQITVTGMVLSAMPIGEYDKRLVILTKERGKLSAFAKGVRRQNSPDAAASQPFIFGTFTLYEGRTSYTVQQVEVQNYFDGLRRDLEMIYHASYFCELADDLTREYNDEKNILLLLYQTLRALMRGVVPAPLIRAIYEIKALAYYGQAMEVFSCVKCGSQEALAVFDSEAGGMLCGECKGAAGAPIPVSDSTLYTLQFILGSSLEKLYSFRVSEQVMAQLKAITAQYCCRYVDKRQKSLDFLEQMDGKA